MTKSDAYRAGVLVIREVFRWQYRIALAISLLIALFFLALHVGAPPGRRLEFYDFDVALTLPILVYCFPVLVAANVTRYVFKHDPRLKGASKYVFSTQGIAVDSSVGHSDLKWSAYVKARETRDYFLLYVSPKMANAIPKRFFSSEADIAEFRSLLRSVISGEVQLQS